MYKHVRVDFQGGKACLRRPESEILYESLMVSNKLLITRWRGKIVLREPILLTGYNVVGRMGAGRRDDSSSYDVNFDGSDRESVEVHQEVIGSNTTDVADFFAPELAD